MKLPIKVTFRGLDHSEALDAYVREHVQKLETFSSQLIGCHVVVELPHRHRHGGHVRVCIDLTVPGGEVVVSHAPEASLVNQDAYAAIDHAFEQMTRRLKDHVRRKREETKPHAVRGQ